jgi:hypothetical protein
MDTIWSIIQLYLSQRATFGLYYFETINNSGNVRFDQNFSIKHAIEAMTGKNRVDTLFARFMNFAVSVFHGLVMFGVCQYGYRNINNHG